MFILILIVLLLLLNTMSIPALCALPYHRTPYLIVNNWGYPTGFT